ncbi:MAG: hypothetical protein GEU79_11940 [Acidimicrobiia bacterium]|nr:hypothetical protein [Acidimicrobiia bacterium]
MTRLGAILIVSMLVVASCSDGSAGSTTTTSAPATTIPEGSTTPATSPPTTSAPEVWEDSACLGRFDPPRAAPPDGFVPHFVCEDDPTRIAPVARGFRDPMEAIDVVLDGPSETEAAVGFVGVGHAGGYDLFEEEDTIEVVLIEPTTPELAAAVKATLERGTTKEVTVR